MYIVERRGVSLGALVYVIIGLVVALSNGYAVASLGQLLNFILVLFLWPLVLLGVNLHVFP